MFHCCGWSQDSCYVEGPIASDCWHGGLGSLQCCCCLPEDCQAGRTLGPFASNTRHLTGLSASLWSGTSGRCIKHLAPQFDAPNEGRPSHLLELLDWAVGTGCALHDCHNSLKWGLHAHFNDAELMKDLYITIQSGRDAFACCMSTWDRGCQGFCHVSQTMTCTQCR